MIIVGGRRAFGPGDSSAHDDFLVFILELMSDLDNRSVFLAAAPRAYEEQARRIRADLEHRGITVLSGGETPWPEAQSAINLQLTQSLFSIHLLGDKARLPEAGGSAPVLGALEAALNYSLVQPRFPMFVWCGMEDRATEPRDQSPDPLLTRLDREVGPNTEIVQSSLEDFKSLVYDRLEANAGVPRSEPARNASSSGSGSTAAGPELYVIFDQQDRETVKPITDFIQQSGVTVLESVFEGEQSTLRSIHNDYLRRCDAALIIYGKVREPWVRMKQQDLLRAPALGRRKSLSAKGVFLCSLMTDMKLRFTAPDMIVMKDSGSSGINSPFDLAGLAPFLQKLSAA